MFRRSVVISALVAAAACGGPGTEMDAGVDAGVSMLVMNTRTRDACGEFVGVLGPYIPDEVGHWSGTRLTPPHYPFTVEAVEYDTYTDDVPGCDVTVTHRVRLYKVARTAGFPTAPSADGGVMAEVTVTPSTGTRSSWSGSDGGFRGEAVSLPITGVTLNADEELVVSVEYAGNQAGDQALCLYACPTDVDAGIVTRSGLDFWSNAVAEPYSWLDLHADFMSEAQLTVRMRGR